MSEYYCIKTHRRIKSHCYMGHEYTPENTLTNTRGNRTCRRCARLNGSARLRKFRKRQALANAAET